MKEKVSYTLKKIDNSIVLTIGNVLNHNYAKFYFFIEEGKEFELTEAIFHSMLEYEEQFEKTIKGKKDFIKELFTIMSEEGE